MRIPDEVLRGRTVIGADGRALGEVSGLTIDSDTLKLDTLQIKLRRPVEDELGVEHKMFRGATIEVPFSKVQSIGDAIVLTVTLDNLRAMIAPPVEQQQPAPA